MIILIFSAVGVYGREASINNSGNNPGLSGALDEPCCNQPGDAGNNGAVGILDVTHLIYYLYKGGPAPICMAEGDPDGNGAINIIDVTYLINFMYRGGPAPVCGPDPWPTKKRHQHFNFHDSGPI